MSSSSTSSSPEPEKVIFTSIDDGTVQWDKRFTFAVPPPHIWVDRRIGDELTDLYREMTLLSKAYFAADLQPWLAAEGISGLARKLANAGELTRIMGAVAVGGPEGHESWWQLFADRKMRMHLVVGVIWRVLREHVFHAYLFGGTEEQVRRLRVMDGEEQKSEGFHRAKLRSRIVKKALSDTPAIQARPGSQKWLNNPRRDDTPTSSGTQRSSARKPASKPAAKPTAAQTQAYTNYRTVPLPSSILTTATKHPPANLSASITNLTLSLYNLLKPLLTCVGTSGNSALEHTATNAHDAAHARWLQRCFVAQMVRVVEKAARIAVEMRLAGETVYCFGGTGRDQVFEGEGMDCLNWRAVEGERRRWVQKMEMEVEGSGNASRKGKGRASVGAGPAGLTGNTNGDYTPNHNVLVRIILMDGCTSYRQYGWKLSDPRGERGFRTYCVQRARVVCRWGALRQVGDQAGPEGQGYKELTETIQDLIGVDPVEDMEQKEMAAADNVQDGADAGQA